MPFWDWFKKKEPEEMDPRMAREVSPGGSQIMRHEGGGAPRLGFVEASVDYAAQREAVYEEMFGVSETVYHEIIPMTPHIDIYTHPAGHDGRPFTTLVTSGMSDLPMTLPRAAAGEPKRVELILYVDQPQQWHCEMLRWIAHFPHDYQTWIGFGHTIPNGNPAQPIIAGSPLDTFFLTYALVSDELRSRLVLAGDPVEFLWVVPITTAECEYKLQHSARALHEIFTQAEPLIVLNEHRQSLV